MAQAATYTWASAGAFYAYDGGDPDWPTVAAGTTAYLVFADAYAQSALVDDFAAGTVDMGKLAAAGAGTILDDGTIGDTAATSSYTSAQQVYVAVFQDETHLFITDEVTAGYDALDTTPFSFTEAETGDIWTSPMDASAGYVGAGWYSAEVVPEPTSGLLLLLGMAGLALRRRRA